jgi:hypothetical protein
VTHDLSTYLTPADLEAMRHRLRELAGAVAETEDQVAATFELLAQSRGDQDGHLRRIAEQARAYAKVERDRAAGNATRAAE